LGAGFFAAGFAAGGTITLWTGITLGCPGSAPICCMIGINV
jgi:hypothetical protein